jgi:hypothetical protein
MVFVQMTLLLLLLLILLILLLLLLLLLRKHRRLGVPDQLSQSRGHRSESLLEGWIVLAHQ